jgi:hypothetical protein
MLRILKEKIFQNKNLDYKKNEKACEILKPYETVKHSQFSVIVVVTEIEA